jgi:hypothetical protein
MELDIQQILNKGEVSSSQYEAITRGLREHPYSSVLSALHTIGVKTFDSGKLDSQVKKSAIRFQSRAALQKLAFPEEPKMAKGKSALENVQSSDESGTVDELNDLLISEAVNSGAALDLILEDATTLPRLAPEPTPKIGQPAANQQKVEEVSTSERQESEAPGKQDFGSWMRYFSDENDDSKNETSKILKQEVDGIIDHFIMNESSLVPKRAEFFSPTKAAKGSLVDNEEIVTETLGRIYAGQGAFDKAISTYQKLSLRHPEKSSYFAALIEKLKQENK